MISTQHTLLSRPFFWLKCYVISSKLQPNMICSCKLIFHYKILAHHDCIHPTLAIYFAFLLHPILLSPLPRHTHTLTHSQTHTHTTTHTRTHTFFSVSILFVSAFTKTSFFFRWQFLLTFCNFPNKCFVSVLLQLFVFHRFSDQFKTF